MTVVQRIWSSLNADITPAFKNLINQLKALYEPQLVPIKAGGIVLEWVDSRTSERPWFS